MDKTALAGYLAIHHHKANMAMLFLNPSSKVRILLFFVLVQVHRDRQRYMEAMYHRAFIRQAMEKVQEIEEGYEGGELKPEETIRMVELWLAKAEMSTRRLTEIANATTS